MYTIFGTDGIRSTFGTQWLTPNNTYAIAHAVAYWLSLRKKDPITIAIASDTRASRNALRAWIYSALHLYPYQIIDYGIIPTPAFVRILKEHYISCGIMITASHNQFQDNGIKIFAYAGQKLSKENESEISFLALDALQQPQSYERNCALQTNTQFSEMIQATWASSYKQFLFQHCTPSLHNWHIILDTAAGATHTIAPEIFRTYGATVTVISPDPNGYNINAACGSTYTKQLQHEVIKHNADIGFAFDGDGDRVIAVNQDGIIKDGDDILAILTHHPAYKDASYVIGTVMSNLGLHDYLKQQGLSFIPTQVGDKHVMQELHRLNGYLGGEPSGHIILRDCHTTGDGILTALRLLEAMIATHNWHLESFEKYHQITYTIPVQEQKPFEAEPLRSTINAYQQRIDGRIYARYSGTEPVIRLLVESKDHEHARQVGQQAKHAITQIIGASCNE